MKRERTSIKMPSNNTRTDILKYLLGNQMTALELKEVLCINESAVRRHLQKLENRGLIEHHFEKASKGRPKKYYKLTDEGMELFPRETDLLLNILIKRLEQHLPEEEMEEIMRRVGDDIKDYLEPQGEYEDMEEKLNKLIENFNRLGFFCSFKKQNGKYQIEYRNCIFSDVSKNFAKYICGIHEETMRDVLGDDIDFEQTSSILAGDEVCQQVIKKGD
ncbi:MAG: helix-turn-helix transcriptional regulator [Thermoplasmatota archaeon]